MTSVLPTPPSSPPWTQLSVLRRTAAALAAWSAIVGRIAVAPALLLVFVSRTRYLTTGKVFLEADESYFAFSPMDAVMTGGCTNCDIGCRKTFMQLARFGHSALISKPTYESLYIMTEWNNTSINADALELANMLDEDPVADCMSGVTDWGSGITTVAGSPQQIVDTVKLLNLSVPPQALHEVKAVINTISNCSTRWVLQTCVRLFKFQAIAHSSEYSSISAGDFTIFPEYTECRGTVPTDEMASAKLALATHGTDLVETVPSVLQLFPYSFTSSLPQGSHAIPASDTVYAVREVTQPLFHAYYGACRVCHVNSTGVYIEESCTVDSHWNNYGLMIQAPDDIPVCSTTDVCVHNYYNSLWEFVAKKDTAQPDRFLMFVNVFRSRFADSVDISVLPGAVVVQILFMGMISLYQIMAHKRSLLLAQIWAYWCQNGRMQVMYLAQIGYHLAYNSDLYYLGLTTGTLSIESIGNLTLCFFAFSYSFVNLLKARSGEQRLDRHFRLVWEIMQLMTTAIVGALLYQHQFTSLSSIVNWNGDLLRKTTARGAKYCNLSDSCIVFKFNLAAVATLIALVLGIVPLVASFFIGLCSRRSRARIRRTAFSIHDGSMPSSPTVNNLPIGPPFLAQRKPKLTSFEKNCLGVPFTRLFRDCGDFSHVQCGGRRCSSVEAVLLTGFLYNGKHLYQAPAVVLLLMARLLPRKVIRTFNIVLVRWHVDTLQSTVSSPSACTWYAASAEQHKLTSTVAIK